MRTLLIFISLNVANVIIQTVKSLATVKCGKELASIVNAVAYGLYTVVLVWTMADLPLATKVIVVALCNLVGVYIVKWLEEKARRDKIWEIRWTIKGWDKATCLIERLSGLEIPYTVFETLTDNVFVFNVYCETQKESSLVKNLINNHGGKYFVTESKTL